MRQTPADLLVMLAPAHFYLPVWSYAHKKPLVPMSSALVSMSLVTAFPLRLD